MQENTLVIWGLLTSIKDLKRLQTRGWFLAFSISGLHVLNDTIIVRRLTTEEGYVFYTSDYLNNDQVYNYIIKVSIMFLQFYK